jgi:hypothetical protein
MTAALALLILTNCKPLKREPEETSKKRRKPPSPQRKSKT